MPLIDPVYQAHRRKRGCGRTLIYSFVRIGDASCGREIGTVIRSRSMSGSTARISCACRRAVGKAGSGRMMEADRARIKIRLLSNVSMQPAYQEFLSNDRRHPQSVQLSLRPSRHISWKKALPMLLSTLRRVPGSIMLFPISIPILTRRSHLRNYRPTHRRQS
jgi:hypothetical protein